MTDVVAPLALERLLSPLTIRGARLRNRIVSTPHATGWGHDGLLSDAEVAYHARKAEGGCGLVMTFGSASVDPSSAAAYGSISLWDPQNEPALRALADRVHRAGGACIAQMTHMGRRGSSGDSGVPLRSASDVPERVHREVPVPLEDAEIEQIVVRFAEAAARLRACGWDGVEVTSWGGHLIEQFFDPLANHRTDRWGGSLDNRLRLAREVLGAVRGALSDEQVLGFRMTLDQRLPDGILTPADLQDIAVALCADGAIDLLSVTGSTGDTPLAQAELVPPGDLPPQPFDDLAADMKQRVGAVDVLVAGRVLDAQAGERTLERTGAELVALTRAIIADPDLPRLAATGGRARPCISLNQSCIGRLYEHGRIHCAVNPGIRDPALEAPAPAGDARTVVVVGAGVAGLEAAAAAAERGHRVTVLEARADVGGRARLASRRTGRERWLLDLDWLLWRAQTAGAQVRLGASATAAAVLALDPDVVVVATGSRARLESLDPGLPAVDADAVIEHGPDPAWQRGIVVFDDEGRFSAPTVAELVAAAGVPVEIVTPLPHVGFEIDPTQLPFVHRRLVAAGVRVRTGSTVAAGPDGSVLVASVHVPDVVAPREAVDAVVVCGLRAGERALAAQLRASEGDIEVRVVGDALAPRLLHDAVTEGARAGRAV
jgi:2,4-dienoyl-CoA reductase-like NADH-dependent reductase (Old Yellow Enzyme family)